MPEHASEPGVVLPGLCGLPTAERAEGARGHGHNSLGKMSMRKLFPQCQQRHRAGLWSFVDHLSWIFPGSGRAAPYSCFPHALIKREIGNLLDSFPACAGHKLRVGEVTQSQGSRAAPFHPFVSNSQLS